MTSTTKQLVHGVLYTAISKYAGIIISLVVAGILARLLSPSDFGIVAVATVIIAFFSIFSDLGIAPAIIQNQTLTQKDLDNIFTFTLWSGAGISALFFLLSWSIADYYDSQILRSICQLLSVNLFFATINIVPNALLYKAKRFRFIAMRTLIVQTICGAVSIGAVFMGAGIFALLINPICSSMALFCVNIAQYPQKVRLRLDMSPIKKIFSFSMYQFFFNLINYFTRNLDKILIGKYMGMSPLGYYEKSYRLMMLPLQNITHVISPVLHPIFAEFQNDMQRLSESYVKVVRFLAFIGFPLSVFLFFTAGEITLIVFGDQWIESIAVFRILALSVGVQIIMSTAGSMFQAANSTKVLFVSGLFSALLNVAGIVIGIFVYNSLTAVAWGIVITFTINFVQTYICMYYVTFKLAMRSFWKQFISPFVISTVLIVALYFVSTFTSGLSLVAAFVIKGCIFAIILGAYIQFTGEFNIFAKIRSLLK